MVKFTGNRSVAQEDEVKNRIEAPLVLKTPKVLQYNDDSFHDKFCAEAPKYLKEALRRLKFSPDELKQHQTNRLQIMLQHAVSNSPFYANALKDIDITKITASDLSVLPVLRKDIVMDNWDDIVTDPRLTYDGARAHMASLLKGETTNPILYDEFAVFATGGSSGKRGVFVWDKELALTGICGYYCREALVDADRPSAAATRPKRTACIHAAEWLHVSRLLFPTKTDCERERRVFSASAPIADIARQLEEYQPDRINGYPSVIVELAHMTLAGRLNISPEMISTYAEPLEDSGREAIRKAWGVEIVNNAYGSTEVGMVSYEGFDPSHRGTMSMSEDCVLVEFVNDQYETVEDPNQATKCLMTRLYGKIMPLFRYEMTDKLVLCEDINQPTYRRIARIDGRTDIWFTYDADGADGCESNNHNNDTKDHEPVRVHPILFRHILGQIDDIIEYQVRQTPKGADILLVTKQCDLENGCNNEDCRDYDDFGSGRESGLETEVQQLLTTDLIKAGVKNAQVKVKSVTDLPRHPETNKLRRFVPL